MWIIPRRIGSEQRVSDETAGSQVLARFTAGVAPAQAAVGEQSGSVRVIYGAQNGPTTWGIRIRTVLDDGTMTPTSSFTNQYMGNASCSDYGFATIQEQIYVPPSVTWFPGIITSWVRGQEITLAVGTSTDFGKHPDRLEVVFAPTISREQGPFGYLAMWHRGQQTNPAMDQRETVLCGCFVSGPDNVATNHDFEVVAMDDARYVSGAQPFSVPVHFPLTGGLSPATMYSWGYAYASQDSQVVVKVMDMAFGLMQTGRYYVSQYFPRGMEVAVAGGELPVLAWIDRDNGNVMVSFSEMAGPNGRQLVFRDPIVANKPLTWPRLGNRRPAVTKTYGWLTRIAVLWESYDKDANGYPTTEIKAKVFTLAGAPVSDEFNVNTIGARNQVAPNVVGLTNGFYAVWMDSSGQAEAGETPDTDGWCIKGQRWSYEVVDSP